MADKPPFPYRVCWPTVKRNEIVVFRTHARERGLGAKLLADLKLLQERLTSDPLDWGDPAYHHHYLDLLVYHRTLDLIHIYYAVDSLLRIVYIEKVLPMPSQGLDP